MILEGPMIFLAVLALTILHPGFAFDGNWQAAGWSFKQRKGADDENIGGKEHIRLESR
jgi:hypothetical protein